MIDDRVMTDLWWTDIWLMIDGSLFDDWLIIDLLMIDAWLMIDE